MSKENEKITSLFSNEDLKIILESVALKYTQQKQMP